MELEFDRVWKDTLKIFKDYEIEEVTMSIEEREDKTRKAVIEEMDESHVVLVRAVLEEESRETEDSEVENYEEDNISRMAKGVNEISEIGLDVGKVHRVLSFSSYPHVKAKFNSSSLIMDIDEQQITLPLIDTMESELPEPELDFTHKGKFEISPYLSKLNKVFNAENVGIETNGNSRLNLTYRENGTVNYKAELGDLEAEEEEIKNKYSYKLLKPLKKTWTFSIGQDYPLQAERSENSGKWKSEIMVLIAPRVSSD